MNWDKLFSMQEQLDKYIESNHNMKDIDVFQEKYLALLVELGELANETRCFKFWSKKPRNEKSIILEEYVDGIHFILSLGIEKGYKYEAQPIEAVRLTETEQFNLVFEACTSFKQNPTKINYDKMFKKFLQLGDLLGFSESDIQQAYLKKNEINYERQNQGY
ncbi:dUTPase [Virgibacillus profundi]|uniref:dUTPase n=1 Tax=Virgibacillus profundi TaxID=2024555 RepID=A0A2A2IH49_9BACI|nr:dUTP diphosphatase [Virgibacillus profundi]PAV30423.1 dUTPase [Virgibacillus profundi]PXY54595.1 dUTPase [Virgibacillus profundi]